MKFIRILFVVSILLALSVITVAANQDEMKCISKRYGQCTMVSEERPELNGSYTYGVWTFEVKTGDKHTFTYDDITTTIVSGKSPEEYLAGMKIFGKAIASLKAPISLLSMELSLSNGSKSVYKTGVILDSEAGGIGFTMLSDGTVEVVILIKNIGPDKLKSFSLVGFDVIKQ